MGFRVSLVNLLTAAAAAGIVASALWAADNLTIKEPTTPTATVKSDDVGGVHYQGFKIYDATPDGSTGLVVTAAGAAKVDGSAVTQPVSGSVTADTELPAGVTPADNQTNAVTIPLVGGFAYVFDGATWDRAPGNSASGLVVDLGANNDVTVTSGTVTANQGGAPWSENVSQFGGSAVATGVGVSGAGIPRVTIASDAHDAPITERGIRISGLASAAAPTAVSADQDMVSLWALRNGQLVQQPAFSGTLASTGSGASGTGTQRVILATDQPVVPVSDNAGSLTVDGTVSVSGTVTVDTEFANQTDGAAAGTTGIQVLGTDGTNAQIIKTDTTGAVQIDCETGCGGGTQFAEDAGHTTGDLGTMALAVRNDAGGPLSGTTLDYTPLQTDANGALRVTGGGGGTEYTEDAVAATDPVGGQIMLRRRDTLAAETTADGDVVAANATNKGEIYVKHVDAIPVTDNAGSLTVDAASLPLPTGASTLAEQQTQTAALQLIDNLPKTEDTASADGDTGAVLLARRTATPANTSGADLDYEALQMAAGRLWTSATIDTALPAGNNNIGDVDVASSALPTGAATSANQATEITALQIIDNLPLADDAAFTVATTNVAAMGCIEATDTMDAGDVGAAKCGNDRELDIDLVSAIPAGTNNIGDVDVLTGPTDASAFEVQGTQAHDAAAAQNPVLEGLYAETAEDTAPGNQVSAEADAVRAVASRDGAQYVLPYGPRIWEVSEEYTTQQTDTSLKAAPGAGLSFYITDISVYCNAAVTVTIEDDEVTDDILHRYYCGGQGDGNERHLMTPIKTGANQSLLVTTSAAVTVFVGVSGYTGP